MSYREPWMAKGEPWYNEERLDRAMADANLDAIIARSARDVVYLSGIRIPGTLQRYQDLVHSPRPQLVVYPSEGAPTLVTNSSAHDLAVESGWIDDVRAHTPYEVSPWTLCVDRLEELGLADGRLGLTKRDVNAEDWAYVERKLPAAEFVDCFDLMNRVRNVKTEEEIEALRRSVEIQDRAHDEVFDSATSGDTEKDLHAGMVGSMIERGAEWAHGMMQSSNTPSFYGGEGPVPIEDGDLVKTDYASYYRGYAANLSRMGVMGSATEEQRGTFRDIQAIQRATVEDVLEPGVEAREVWAAVHNLIEEYGYDSQGYMAGHSTGVWWHQEEPIFLPNVETELRAGMVVCLEPIMEDYWHVQDQILITETGAEVLSAGYELDELPVL